MSVVIACDAHKASVTIAVLDERRAVVHQQTFATNRDGRRSLLNVAKRWPHRRWAVEGAAGTGAGIAQHLVAAGEQVSDVPAKLATRVRLLSRGHGRKNDAADAIAIGIAAIDHHGLNTVTVEGHETTLRLLSDRRDDLTRQRTQTMNRLHDVLAHLVPGETLPRGSVTAAAELLRRVRPTGDVVRTRRQIAADLIGDLRHLDKVLKDLERRTLDAVEISRTSLTELFGIGPTLAAKILGHVGNVTRFATKDHFASYTGTAPLEASSGDVTRHRLSRVGNRQLNSALYIMALSQIRQPTAGQDYYRRKLAEGKSRKEALRCVKRRLSDVIYRTLLADADRHQLAMT
jgi:transposase